MDKKNSVERTITEKGFYICGIVGMSMLPLLREGVDSACISKLTSLPVLGDVILYKRGDGTLVLHRIVSVSETGYGCMGDNHERNIEYIDTADIIGVMNALYRNNTMIDCKKNIIYKAYRALWLNMRFRVKALRILKYLRRQRRGGVHNG